MDPSDANEELTRKGSQPSVATRVATVGRIAGPLASIVVFWLIRSDPGVSYEAAATAAVAALMAVWWMTEALPLGVTALLPLVMMPLLGVFGAPTKENKPVTIAAAPYADPAVFLFLGGFFLALAIEKWGLHRRFALLTLLAVGTRPPLIVAGFLIATAFISLWISNTATTVMMLPIALSIVKMVEESPSANQSPQAAKSDARRLATSLMLGVAYASSIGGCGTFIGTPTNTIFAGFLRDKDLSIDFGRWMLFAIPLVVVYLILCWWLLTWWLFPVRTREVAGGRAFVVDELARLGALSRGEWTVLVVFLLAATAWIGREPLAYVAGGSVAEWLKRCDDAVIAVAAAIVLFLLPVDLRRGIFALDWKTASKAPWEVLLMFGGGLSLSLAIGRSGLDDYIGGKLVLLGELPTPLLLSLLSLAIIFFSELTSNVATISMLQPIVYGLAQKLEVDPLLLLVPCALSCSYAFMLPAGTPPNAIAYGSGRVTMGEMMRAGFWLNLAGGLLIPLAVLTLGRWVLGIRL